MGPAGRILIPIQPPPGDHHREKEDDVSAEQTIENMFGVIRGLIETVVAGLWQIFPQLFTLAMLISIATLIFGLISGRPGATIGAIVGILVLAVFWAFSPDLINGLLSSAGDNGVQQVAAGTAVSGGGSSSTGANLESVQATLGKISSK
jgi:hypothetical protein